VLGGFNPEAASSTPATSHSAPEVMSNEDRMNFGLVLDPPAIESAAPSTPSPIEREPGLNFGSANPRPPEPGPKAEPETGPDTRLDTGPLVVEPPAESGDLPA
jgi:hypothetical protein